MEYKRGDYVRVSQDADNFAGAIGRVVEVNEVTCEVEVVGYTGAFMFKELEKVDLKLVRERTYRMVEDAMKMPWELNGVAKEFEAEGYEVKRTFGGTVVVSMSDGEIHFVPDRDRIKEYVFQTQQS